MHKYVLAVFALYETVPFSCVIPLDSPFHFFTSSDLGVWTVQKNKNKKLQKLQQIETEETSAFIPLQPYVSTSTLNKFLQTLHKLKKNKKRVISIVLQTSFLTS